jgi:hypothetical protein
MKVSSNIRCMPTQRCKYKTARAAIAPSVDALRGILPDTVIEPGHLALLTSKYWGAKGVRLTVG